jgi:hypothetical protein
MLGPSEPRVVRTKNQKGTTKIDLIPGHVERRRVRCGKANCRCARGQFHAAHYHVWKSGGVRYQRFVRRADVPAMLAACDEYRRLQAQLRAGRAEFKRTLAAFRALFGG